MDTQQALQILIQASRQARLSYDEHATTQKAADILQEQLTENKKK